MYSLGTTPPLMELMNSKPAPCFVLAKAQPDVTVLAATTGLADEFTLDFDGVFADSFAVGNLRLADVGFNVKFALHAVDDDFQVQLTHTRDDGLAGFVVNTDAEGWVFFGQALQGDAHLFLVGLGLWLDSDRYWRIWEGNAFENNWVVRVAKRITGSSAFKADDGGNVTGTDFGDVFTLIGLQTDNTANALFFAG